MRGRAAAACLAAIAVAGCGSDDSEKHAFINQANAICKRGNAEVRAITARIVKARAGSDPATVFRQLAAFTTEAGATYSRYVDQLDALTPPAGDRDRIKAWIAGQRRQLGVVNDLGKAFKARDQTQISRLSERIDVLTQSNNDFAKRYGMAECAKPT